MACHRNYDLVQAEQVFLQGLRELFVEFNEQSLELDLFEAMASNLASVYRTGTIQLESSQEITSAHSLFIVLSATLHVAGFSGS